MFRATCWSDTPRSLASSRPETPKSSILERPLRATYQGRSQPERPAQVARVLTGRDTKKRVGNDLLAATMLDRSACFAWTIFMLFQGPFGHLFCCFAWPKPKLST
ncbi:hypothetical protein F2Q69_00004223 [Brassica cretica]|uniref:Uncharacterized protein n=1 Tax=Brassica cretica TaxID=69181 RepID=A0A8S9PHT1_BRACR|nr:hypothetical protein F2Q69_00004223 [Brassica cretica]